MTTQATSAPGETHAFRHPHFSGIKIVVLTDGRIMNSQSREVVARIDMKRRAVWVTKDDRDKSNSKRLTNAFDEFGGIVRKLQGTTSTEKKHRNRRRNRNRGANGNENHITRPGNMLPDSTLIILPIEVPSTIPEGGGQNFVMPCLVGEIAK